MKHSVLKALFAAPVVAFASLAMAGSPSFTIDEISPSVQSGDGITPGSTLTVLVSVTANTSGIAPAAPVLDITYPNDALDYSSIAGIDPDGAGPAVGFSYSAATPSDNGNGTDTVRVAGIDQNHIDGDTTPDLFEISFLVLGTATPGYDILFDLAPGANSLIFLDPSTSIPTTGGEVSAVNDLLAVSESNWELLD